MINAIVSYLKNKKILILGFGREGKSSLSFIQKHLPDTFVSIRDKNSLNISLGDNVDFISGDRYLDDLNEFDIILKSPGITLKNIAVDKNKISSQLDLFLKYSKIITIGITGTKGKTTTSTLVYNILKHSNKSCFLLGNIGVPVFECLDELTSDSIAVIEMSSHQLEFMTHSPNIAILTNLYPEHLDHYISYQHYINAKLNIFRFQHENDNCIFLADQQDYIHMIQSCVHSHSISVSLDQCDASAKTCLWLDKHSTIIQTHDKNSSSHICVKNLNKHLCGKHHFYDIMFAFAACNILGISDDFIESSLKEFSGIPHRMEYIGCFKGIHFYNDSIATIPAAVMNAVTTLVNVNTLIIGGMDRGIDYEDFAKFLAMSSIEHIVCLYETGKKIANIILNEYPHAANRIFIKKDLYEAVQLAFDKTPAKSICLLSPAAASYGYFKNFEDRGNTFKQLVKQLGIYP